MIPKRGEPLELLIHVSTGHIWAHPRKPFPAPCKVQTALSIYCDLSALPARSTAKKFAPLVQDAADREALFALVQDREAYQILTDGRLTLKDFFELFMQSAEIDLSTFVQICQRQKNRPYTIASSSKEDSTRIGICVSLVQEEHSPLESVMKDLSAKGIQIPRASVYLQKLGASASQPRRFRGLCSEMLCLRTTKGEKLWIAARASSFRLPKRTTTPIIMLGAGTGLAPFRGFVREFMAEKGSRSKTVLFFGCTKSDEDFIYKKEIISLSLSKSFKHYCKSRCSPKDQTIYTFRRGLKFQLQTGVACAPYKHYCRRSFCGVFWGSCPSILYL